MNTQPRELWLADALENWPDIRIDLKASAAELRRLHEANQELLEALIAITKLYDAMGTPRGPTRIIADAAIAKHGGAA